MKTSKSLEPHKEMTNGVDVAQVMSVIDKIEADSGYAKFQWRATNQWVDGAISRSQIRGFFAGNAEDSTRQEEFTLYADEPTIAAGKNSAPNPMEYLLHALATCLTGTLVYHAAMRGIEIEAVESSYAGYMDVRGLFGLADDVRKGFDKVTVNMRVKSNASAEELTELALYSPVHDVMSRALPVEFTLTTY